MSLLFPLNENMYTVWSLQSHIFIGGVEDQTGVMQCSDTRKTRVTREKGVKSLKVLAGHTWFDFLMHGEATSTWTHWGNYLLSLQVSPPQAVQDKRRAPRADRGPWSRVQHPCCCKKVIQKLHYGQSLLVAEISLDCSFVQVFHQPE